MAQPNFTDINELPQELQLEALAAQRKARIADALSSRGMTPIAAPQNKGRLQAAISPMQGIEQVANAYMGEKMARGAESDMQKVSGAYNDHLQQGVAQYLARSAKPMTPAEASQDPGFGQTQQPNPRDVIREALMSRNPLVAKLAGADLAHQNELDKPRDMKPGDRVEFPSGERPTMTNPLVSKKEIPADWEKHLPPGARRLPTDPPGVFRMTGGDGQHDVYAMEFELNKPVGYKRLDNTPADAATRAAGRGVQQVTVQNPLDPTKTLVVNANTYDAEKFKKGDKTGVIGDGPKSSGEGVQRAEGFATFQNVNASLDKLEKQTGLALSSKLGKTVGLMGKVPNIPGSDASVAQSRLDALKTMIGFDVLQVLRNSAHSGASGLGQVTEKEHVYLQQQLGNLEKAASEAEIRRVIGDIQTWIKEARTRYQAAYEARYNAKPTEGGPAAGSTLRFDAQGNLIQ